MWWKGSGSGPEKPQSEDDRRIELQNTAGWWPWNASKDSKPVTEPAPESEGNPALDSSAKENTSLDSKSAPINSKEQGKNIEVPEPDSNTPQEAPGRTWAFWGTNSKAEIAVAGTDTESNPQKTQTPPQTKKSRPEIPSTLVPTFEESFSYPALLGRLWAKQPYQVAPYRPKKAVVIGIHGYFPARIARTLLGEPTGTSIKFASEGASMLENWAATNGIKMEIEKIALEGEGRIAEREQALFELLKNWMDTLRKADFIFFAVHSQGAVVGVHIIARLIEEYRISAKIGLLAMAGVCLGPMPGMDQKLVMKAISTIENRSLMELFELQNSESVQSQKFKADLRAVLKHGVKTVFVASADDQLVPLYSALCTHVDHPNIFRAVYLDGDTISPKFLAPLLSLAVRRRNSGHSDHGFFSDISNSIAGSLTGSGHSRLYSSDQVYTLALRAILETSHTTKREPTFHEFRLPKQNPYLLPWSVHAMLTDASAVPQLATTVETVYRDYGTWKPSTKPMKDLRYRLAALKKAKL